MNRSISCIRKLGMTGCDLCASAAGYFVFTRGFHLVEHGKEGSDAAATTPVASPSRSPLAGIGAAVFLLAFISSEAMAIISALRR
jgi:hypothetical protein